MAKDGSVSKTSQALQGRCALCVEMEMNLYSLEERMRLFWQRMMVNFQIVVRHGPLEYDSGSTTTDCDQVPVSGTDELVAYSGGNSGRC